MAAQYEISRDRKGEFRFHLKAANGEIILANGGYKTRGGCETGIASVQRNSSDGGLYERRKVKNERHYFVLWARNKRIISRSQIYNSEAAMEDGIQSVQKHGSTKKVQDLT